MKVAIVCGEAPAAKAGGIGTVVHYLNEGLSERGIEVDFYCSDKFAGSGFPATYLSQWGVHPLHDLTLGYSFSRLNDKLDCYDVVDFHLPNGRGPLLLHRLDPARVVATLHTTSVGYKRNVYSRLPFAHLAANERRQKLGAIEIAIMLERLALRRASVINCVADNLVREVVDLYGFDNTVRTRKAVRMPVVERKDYDNSRAPFLFVGRLVAQKGMFDLLEAYRRSGVQRSLQIVGDGVLREQIESLVRQHDLNIQFLGYRTPEQLVEIFIKSFALLVPSLYETQPMVSFEAAAYGLPVVGYDTASIGDAVSMENQKLIVNGGDIDSFATIMRELDKNPAHAKAIGVANRNCYKKHDRFKQMIDDYVSLYQRIIGES